MPPSKYHAKPDKLSTLPITIWCQLTPEELEPISDRLTHLYTTYASYGQFYAWLQKQATERPDQLAGACGDVAECIVAEYFQSLLPEYNVYTYCDCFRVDGPGEIYARLILPDGLRAVVHSFDNLESIETIRWTYAGFFAKLQPDTPPPLPPWFQ